jgi:AcrR family transcriptional regulator/DNA-binding MarR family transcriptional regulator
VGGGVAVRARIAAAPWARSSLGARQRAQAPARLAAPEGRLVEIQRSRLLAGAVAALEELGYAGTTVSAITVRSRVSRRTFYELFENREECLAALLDDVLGMLEGELAEVGLEGVAWRVRVRDGLAVILGFFDREPALARVCVVHSQQGGPSTLARREEIFARLACVIDGARGESARAADCSPLTAEGLVGAAFGIVHARVARGEPQPLTDLLGELMGMIVLPYLGPAAARREQRRSGTGPASAAGGRPSVFPAAQRDPLGEVRMRLTYRTAQVLECIAVEPGISNRVVAERAGVSDQGQISKLLARLERLGLAVNTGEGHAKGEANAWTLTAQGVRVAQRVSARAPSEWKAE